MPTPTRLIPILAESDKLRFISKISTTPTEHGCLDWIACKTKQGYGSIRIGKITFLAHRIAYFLHHGVDPSELDVCHKCDRPSCTNGNHLFLGTHADNMRDMESKCRSFHPRGDKNGARTCPDQLPRGESNGNAKLTAAAILAIRTDTRSQSKIAADYGVIQATICKIKRREIWQHVV